MQLSNKISIVIIIILIIILVISIWSGYNNTNLKETINCEAACIKIVNGNWTYPGAGPVSKIVFSTKEDCVSACRARFLK